MNVVREINKINEKELELGVAGASWHDEYKDSAYIFVGGLNFELTEGDVITIFSQYGEVMDVHMPRDKNTGKTRGFAFLMYEDQRSTVLAVDNLNGAKVLERTLRVDHVRDYKQPRIKGEDGEWHDPDEQSFNAKPQIIMDNDAESASSMSSDPSIDPEDPMREFLITQRKEERALKRSKRSKSSKGKHKTETAEERRARKVQKREKKARKIEQKSQGMKGVEALLSSLEQGARRSRHRPHSRTRTPSPGDRRSRSPGGRRNLRDGRMRSYSRPPSRSRDNYESRGNSRRDDGYADARRRRRPDSRDHWP